MSSSTPQCRDRTPRPRGLQIVLAPELRSSEPYGPPRPCRRRRTAAVRSRPSRRTPLGRRAWFRDPARGAVEAALVTPSTGSRIAAGSAAAGGSTEMALKMFRLGSAKGHERPREARGAYFDRRFAIRPRGVWASLRRAAPFARTLQPRRSPEAAGAHNRHYRTDLTTIATATIRRGVEERRASPPGSRP